MTEHVYRVIGQENTLVCHCNKAACVCVREVQYSGEVCPGCMDDVHVFRTTEHVLQFDVEDE